MRLIDADALIEDIKTKLWDWDTVDGITSSTVLKQTITDIGNAPIVDAVPVVRCKDCQHCEYASNRIPTEQAWVCYKLGIDVVQDWFCADGERKDDEL